MGCEVFEFMGHPAIICGPGINPKPKRCAFCEHRSSKLCDWPVEKVQLVPAASLKPGQRIYPFAIKKNSESYLLLSVEMRREDPAYFHGRDRVLVVWEWHGKPQMPYSMSVNGKARLVVPGTCDKPCCYRHSRHVGPDRDYCQDHWRQENIA